MEDDTTSAAEPQLPSEEERVNAVAAILAKSRSEHSEPTETDEELRPEPDTKPDTPKPRRRVVDAEEEREDGGGKATKKLTEILDRKEPFSEEELRANAEFLRSSALKIQNSYAGLKSKTRKVEEKSSELTEREHVISTRESQIRNIVQGLFTGTISERLDVLARISGKTAADAIDEINYAVATGGKPRPDARVKELETKLEMLERAQLERQQAERLSQENVQYSRLVFDAVQSGSWPTIAQYAEKDPDAVARQVYNQSLQRPEMTLADVMDLIEARVVLATERQRARPTRPRVPPAPPEDQTDQRGPPRMPTQQDRVNAVAEMIRRARQS